MRREWRALAMIMAAVALSGCATLKLYNATDDARSKAAVDAQTKAREAEAQLLADLRARQADLAKKETSARQAQLVAMRDTQLASFIRPVDVPVPGQVVRHVRGPNDLLEEIDNRLHALTGRCQAVPDTIGKVTCEESIKPNELYQWMSLLIVIEGKRSLIRSEQAAYEAAVGNLASAQAEHDRKKAESEKDKPKSKTTEDAAEPGPEPTLVCADIFDMRNAGTLDAAVAAHDVPDAYRSVVGACDKLEAAEEALRPGGEVLKGVASPGGKSLLTANFARVAKLEAEQTRLRHRAAALQRAVAALRKRAGGRDTQADFRKFIDGARKQLAIAPDAARLLGLEELGTLIDDVLKAEISAAVEKADNKGGDAPAATVPAAATDEAKTDDPSVTTKKASAALGLVDALLGFADANTPPGPAAKGMETAYGRAAAGQRINAMIIASAAQRHELDMARLAEKHLAERLRLLQAEQMTLLTEVALVSEARLFAARYDTDQPDGIVELSDRRERDTESSAVVRYGLAWNEGRIPYNLLRIREVQLAREQDNEVTEKTLANYHGLIKPALDELRAAGQAGIRSDTIATLLGNFGIAGAILGK